MKTWWDYWPLMAMGIVLPILIGCLPTVHSQFGIFGGGIIRQEGINLIANWLPVEAGQRYVDAFMEASTLQEIVYFLPISLNISAFLALIIYLFVTVILNISNWMTNSEYKQQRKASKGA